MCYHSAASYHIHLSPFDDIEGGEKMDILLRRGGRKHGRKHGRK